MKSKAIINLFTKAFRIHSVWIKIGRGAFLLIGHNNEGKTTLANLWLAQDGKSKIFEDDGRS